MSNIPPPPDRVVLTEEDIKTIESLYQIFEMDMPEYLKNEIDIFRQNTREYTTEQQNRFRSMYALAWTEMSHELFDDPIFDKIKESCRDVSYDEAFNLQMQGILTENKD